MAGTTIRRKGELVRGVFSILRKHREGLQVRLVLQELEAAVPPTEFELESYESTPNTRRYEKVVRFSTIGPVKAGWLFKDKGQWTVTDEGLAAFERFPDPEEFMRESGRLYRVWKQTRPDAVDEEDPSPATDAVFSLEEAEEAAREAIRRYLSEMPPYEFQELVAALLRAMGYHVDWVSPPGPDGGLDIVAFTDPLGTVAPRIKVQVKRRADKTGAQDLRAFVAVLGSQDVGIFVSTGGFSSEAQREARSLETRRLTLVDLDRLVELWIEHLDRLGDTERQLLPLKPVHYLAPA